MGDGLGAALVLILIPIALYGGTVYGLTRFFSLFLVFAPGAFVVSPPLAWAVCVLLALTGRRGSRGGRPQPRQQPEHLLLLVGEAGIGGNRRDERGGAGDSAL